jgi:hypothetical protein
VFRNVFRGRRLRDDDARFYAPRFPRIAFWWARQSWRVRHLDPALPLNPQIAEAPNWSTVILPVGEFHERLAIGGRGKTIAGAPGYGTILFGGADVVGSCLTVQGLVFTREGVSVDMRRIEEQPDRSDGVEG